jgi:hypothetical protein
MEAYAGKQFVGIDLHREQFKYPKVSTMNRRLRHHSILRSSHTMWRETLIALVAAILLSWLTMVVALVIIRPKATCFASLCGSCLT